MFLGGILHNPKAKELEEAFSNYGFELNQFKTVKKAIKSFGREQNQNKVLLLDSHEMATLDTQVLKKQTRGLLLVGLQKDRSIASKEQWIDQGYDLIFSLTMPAENIAQRVISATGESPQPKLEGSAKKLAKSWKSISKDYPKLSDHFEVITGLSLPTESLERSRTDDIQLPFIRRDQVRPYQIQGQPLYWNPEKDDLIKEEELQSLARAPKCFVHFAAPPMIAAIDREGRFCGPSAYALIPKDGENIEALCAWLNSRYIDFYFHYLFTPRSELKQQGALRPFDLNQIPIPIEILKGDQQMTEWVQELETLLHTGAGWNHNRVTELRFQIDQLIQEWIQMNPQDLELLEKLYFKP